jgi:SAM-dependent methyltransferase
MSAFRRAADRLLELPVVFRTWQAPFARAKLRPFLERVDPARLERVLDVGCGPGTNAPIFRASGYVGVDINPAYVSTAARRFGGQFVVGDVTDPSVLPEERFDCVFANSLMHHLDDQAVTRLLARMAQLTTAIGEVHILDLVLPPTTSAARAMAQLDRGRFARPLQRWRDLFSAAMTEVHFQPYPLGVPGLPLWQMVYFVGRRR